MNSAETEAEQVAISSLNETVVIAVHGTGASNVNNSGDWWQNGSEFETELLKSIPRGVTIEPPFHWSGDNLESSRLRAASELYARLKKLDGAFESRARDFSESDRQRFGYHLVGHSHGGAVIWHALRLSIRRKHELKYLRSWATMGTPYLNFSAVRFPWAVLGSLAVLLFLATGIAIDANQAPREWI